MLLRVFTVQNVPTVSCYCSRAYTYTNVKPKVNKNTNVILEKNCIQINLVFYNFGHEITRFMSMS